MFALLIHTPAQKEDNRCAFENYNFQLQFYCQYKDLDADHSGGDIIYGYMGVHPTTEQLWVGKSTYTQSAVHVYDVSRSDALEFSSFYQKKASPAGVDFAYRFSDEWINR